MSPSEAIERGRPFRVEPPPVPSAPAILPRTLTIEQGAHYVGCSTRQLRYWLALGLLRRIRLGRSVRVDRQRLDQLVDDALRGHALPSRPKSTPRAAVANGEKSPGTARMSHP